MQMLPQAGLPSQHAASDLARYQQLAALLMQVRSSCEAGSAQEVIHPQSVPLTTVAHPVTAPAHFTVAHRMSASSASTHCDYIEFNQAISCLGRWQLA